MEEIGRLDMKEIEERIKERVGQIERIVGFIVKLADEIGETIFYSQGSCNTHVTKLVSGFKDFTFIADTGHTMMGGNDFYVWYHPGKKEIDTNQLKPVFSIYFQVSADESEVRIFDSSPEWQKKLNDMIYDVEKIIAEEKKKKALGVSLREHEAADIEKRRVLLERAAKLGL